MKILYGVQGTGNGHITRARLMAREFSRHNIDVTYLFSGRDRAHFFDMQCFGHFLHRQGLTFVTEAGSVRYARTALHNNLLRLVRDITALDLAPYDLILTDFEPVTAWAGRLRRKPTLGVGHQYAFGPGVPKAGDNLIARTVLKHFAPTRESIGYHWHHFEQDSILPPLIDRHLPGDKSAPFYLVYLPFEHQPTITALLNCLEGHRFVQYSPELTDAHSGNVTLRKTCHDGFKQDLSHCRGVICNAGFELVSECLHMQLPLLVKPVAGQMEQLSNAAALRQLGYARTLRQLTPDAIADWLDSDKTPPRLSFPDVAAAVVEWLLDGRREPLGALASRLWAEPGDTGATVALGTA